MAWARLDFCAIAAILCSLDVPQERREGRCVRFGVCEEVEDLLSPYGYRERCMMERDPGPQKPSSLTWTR